MVIRHILGHLLFWMVIMLTYTISEWGYSNNFVEAFLFELFYLPVRLVAVYLNWFVLIPKWLYKNQLLNYLLLLGLLLATLAFVQSNCAIYYDLPPFFSNSGEATFRGLTFSKMVHAMVIITSPAAFSTGIKLFMDWYEQRNKAKQLVIEKREAELKYLKSQINPHFLFNTLNNLYGLSIERSSKLPDLILKLSDFLSYSLYESNTEKTTLGREMQLIRDFVELETYRYENRVNIHWEIERGLDDTSMLPLLFMPLVENAFKHGVREAIKQATIHIKLWNEEKYIGFEVVNSLPGIHLEASAHGIGLNNLRRRLEIGYPGAYILKTQILANHFCATLKLEADG